jgi:hypothetical protein
MIARTGDTTVRTSGRTRKISVKTRQASNTESAERSPGHSGLFCFWNSGGPSENDGCRSGFVVLKANIYSFRCLNRS